MSSISSIDSDELDLCDIETTSDMAPDMAPNPVPVPPLPENGTRVRLGPTPDSSGTVVGDQNTKGEPLRSIDSLLELVQLLPGVVLEDGAYHVRGPVTNEVRESIYTYASQIGELTLTDGPEEGTLGSDIFLCLALLQDIARPLFPSLNRLRIINADSSLTYLRLFISPSLRTLEVTGMAESSRSLLLDFVAAAVQDIPGLESLTLGPGRMSCDVIDAFLGFSCLRHLRLADVASSLDYALLEDIGGLEFLETLFIDGQAASYTPSPSIMRIELEEEHRCMVEEDLRRREEQEVNRMREEDVRRRREDELRRDQEAKLLSTRQWLSRMREQLLSRQRELSPELEGVKEDEFAIAFAETLECTGKKKGKKYSCKFYRQSASIERNLLMCSSCLVEEIKQLHNHETQLQHQLEDILRHQERNVDSEQLQDGLMSPSIVGVQDSEISPSSECHLIDPRSSTLYPSLSSLTIWGSVLIIQDLVNRVGSPSLAHLDLDLVSSPVTTPNLVVPIVKRFSSTIDLVAKRWRNSVAHITLRLDELSSPLPKDTVEHLLRSSALQYLDITGCPIEAASTEDNGLSLSFLSNASKLRVLHLPDNINSSIGIELSQMADIVHRFPSLVSLKCNIKDLSEMPSYPQCVSTREQQHNLEILCVGSASDLVPLKAQHLLRIASYLDALFPNLKSIRTPNSCSQDVVIQWETIEEGVKICQIARQHAIERINLSSKSD